ncbi:MAG TPA: NYN domain-containing protein [Ktedonobacteraceae bacterium]|nr:NYN domain-containing protein [Ktedonobacteraceae bacterium]
MITENTHPEHNDWQEPAAERLSASESATPPRMTDDPSVEEHLASLEVQAEHVPAETQTDTMPVAEHVTRQEELSPTQAMDDGNAQSEQEEPTSTTEKASDASLLIADIESTSAPFAAEQAPAVESRNEAFFSLEEKTLPAEAVRPFTDFIEEFRQTEVRLNALLQDQDVAFPSFTVEASETSALLEMAGESAQTAGEAPVMEEHEQARDASNEIAVASSSPAEEVQSSITQPTFSTERPVSPLLRPATRVRLPRHARNRMEESVKPAELPVEPAKVAGEKSAEIEFTPEVPQVEEAAARPARRYRFDRPAATASASPALAKPAMPSPPVKVADTKEKRTGHTESKPGVEAAGKPAATVTLAPELSAPQKSSAQETSSANPEVSTPAPTTGSERKRRGNHERQREKEQAMPTAEVAAPEPEPLPEVPVEDLPPLEYSELQAASSRRRRRRRVGSASTVAASNGATPSKGMLQDLTPPPAPLPGVSAPLPKSAPSAPVTPLVAPNYNIVSGYTVSQMNQGNDGSGPFMGPEPSPARGSTFTAVPQLRHTRSEALRSSPVQPAKPGESPLMSPASVNHLGNMVAQAIQTQTDRMVAELRRANQVPTNISVSLPPFPSNERVGVFVDVANLLYSARTLRLTVDFGKLLDFLRGNRRLVRAQAYCPTSPQPGDDQMFLQAVKGLGYRITTKNYKTFSSGAKKADLDLDLCMDVVRLVDGNAVDCIVLVSGDSDFMPMLDYCSDHGVRVEVAAFDESMSATLRQSCDLFVNLSMLEEIRA